MKKNPTKISNSAVNTFNDCSQKYKYRYKDRIVSLYKSGALYFGSAVDEAMNVLLSPESFNDRTKAQEAFIAHWRRAEDNSKTVVDLSTSINVTYAVADFDMDLMDDVDITSALEMRDELKLGDNDIPKLMKIILGMKREMGWGNVSRRYREFYNYCNWLCLYRKGLLMIDEYIETMMPLIKEVLAVQKYIEVENDDGDLVRGYIDIVVRLQDGTVCVVDNKTSAITYERDSVRTSQQLGLYAAMLNIMAADPTNEWEHKIDSCGYFVLYKRVVKDVVKICGKCNTIAVKGSRHKSCAEDNPEDGKRCSGAFDRTVGLKIATEIVIDEISSDFQDIILESFSKTNEAIKTGVFTRNLGACFKVWGRCEYYEHCLNKNDKEIIRLPKEESKKK